MITRVEWTQPALRAFTIWIAGFIRDEIGLRVNRRMYVDDVRQTLIQTDGRPPGSYVVRLSRGDSIVWEYVAGRVWLAFRREPRPSSLWKRLRGAPDEEALIVTMMRRPPTLPELEARHR